MYPWGDAPADEHDTPAYAVGETVYSGSHPGTVVSVGETTMGIIWCDGDSAITYPMDAPYLRKALPWEL